jgi:hypothetical protein
MKPRGRVGPDNDAASLRVSGHLARRLAVLTHPSLLVVDEIGYLPINHAGGEVFGDDVMAAALIDRVLQPETDTAETVRRARRTRSTGH